MKLLARIAAVSLVFAGALASSMTPKTHTTPVVSPNSMIISSAMPVPNCDPGKSGCGL
jgi:hypothetical protein